MSNDDDIRASIDMDVIESLKQLGDDSLLEELVEMFTADTPPRLSEIEKACAASDFARMQSAAHALKSSCANLGAMHLSEICREIEDAGRSKSLGRATQLIVIGKEEYARVTRALGACLGK